MVLLAQKSLLSALPAFPCVVLVLTSRDGLIVRVRVCVRPCCLLCA